PSPPAVGGGLTAPEPTPTATAAAAGPDAIEGFAVGEPWDQVTLGIPGFQVVEGCEWWGSTPDGGYDLAVMREQGTDETAPTVLVGVSTAPGDAQPIGPETAAGIRLGSTLTEAQSAYPDAETIAAPGDLRHLRVESGEVGSLFLTYDEGSDVIRQITATTLEQPPYEPCA
uniref:hypothetical protein n=1 Tax=Microbacterium sp. 18062 TaxID=2681410 RepID=UPI00135A7D90